MSTPSGERDIYLYNHRLGLVTLLRNKVFEKVPPAARKNYSNKMYYSGRWYHSPPVGNKISEVKKKLPKDWYNVIAYIPECIDYTDVYTIYNFICNK